MPAIICICRSQLFFLTPLLSGFSRFQLGKDMIILIRLWIRCFAAVSAWLCIARFFKLLVYYTSITSKCQNFHQCQHLSLWSVLRGIAKTSKCNEQCFCPNHFTNRDVRLQWCVIILHVNPHRFYIGVKQVLILLSQVVCSIFQIIVQLCQRRARRWLSVDRHWRVNRSWSLWTNTKRV